MKEGVRILGVEIGFCVSGSRVSREKNYECQDVEEIGMFMGEIGSWMWCDSLELGREKGMGKKAGRK